MYGIFNDIVSTSGDRCTNPEYWIAR